MPESAKPRVFYQAKPERKERSSQSPEPRLSIFAKSILDFVTDNKYYFTGNSSARDSAALRVGLVGQPQLLTATESSLLTGG